jgi:DeoR family transcriptional regulator of aga operon
MTISQNQPSLKRQERIVDFVNQRQRVSIEQICTEFEISEATARRDLEILTSLGKLSRFRGGALSMQPGVTELLVEARMHRQIEEKKRIAQTAANLVNDGETIFLGGGTTVLEVARRLINKKKLTVITNSMLVMKELAQAPDITLVSLGGVLHQPEMITIGHITDMALTQVRAEKVIVGILAIHPIYGLTNDYLPQTVTDRAILAIGKNVIVVADHTKCGKTSTSLVAPIRSIHTLVTDTGVDPDCIQTLRDQGVEVLLA